jgi:hypothetical protein
MNFEMNKYKKIKSQVQQKNSNSKIDHEQKSEKSSSTLNTKIKRISINNICSSHKMLSL